MKTVMTIRLSADEATAYILYALEHQGYIEAAHGAVVTGGFSQGGDSTLAVHVEVPTSPPSSRRRRQKRESTGVVVVDAGEAATSTNTTPSDAPASSASSDVSDSSISSEVADVARRTVVDFRDISKPASSSTLPTPYQAVDDDLGGPLDSDTSASKAGASGGGARFVIKVGPSSRPDTSHASSSGSAKSRGTTPFAIDSSV